jgi:hypothetical protein
MSATELLFELCALGCKLRQEGEQLICNAPKKIMTMELKLKIKKYRQELLALISQDRDILAEDMSTWPQSILEFYSFLSNEFREEHFLTKKEALETAQTHIAIGWVKLPSIIVIQREDGSWPRVQLNAQILWMSRDIKE